MKRNVRRHKTGFGYIGSGNSLNVFNRKPHRPFSELKYKLNSESLKLLQTEFDSEELTDAQRAQIKENVRKSTKDKSIKIAIVTFIFILLFIIIAIEMLNGVLNLN